MKIKVRTNDNVLVEVEDHRDLELSVLIATCLEGREEEEDEDEELPLPNVSSAMLRLILEFNRHFRNDGMKSIPRPLPSSNLVDVVGEWYNSFITRDELTDTRQLNELIKAANYLDIGPLQELGCARIACLIRGNEPGEIRRILGMDD